MIKHFEYWDAELPNQSKKLLSALEEGLTRFGGKIVDQHEDNYFSGKQKWRNPLLLRIKLPSGKRWAFILATKIKLYRPSVIGVPEDFRQSRCKLRGDHDSLRKVHRRNYRFHPVSAAYINTYHPDGSNSIIHGADLVSQVLDGGLDLVL